MGGSGTWILECAGESLVRLNGEVIYKGPTDEMPSEIKEVADTMDLSWEDFLGKN